MVKLTKGALLLLGITGLAVTTQPVYATDWREITDGRKIDMLSRQILPNGNRVFWIMSRLTNRDSFNVGFSYLRGMSYENYSHDLYNYEVNCSNRQSRQLSRYIYSKEGSAMYADTLPERFTPVVPGSVGEYDLDYICDSKKPDMAADPWQVEPDADEHEALILSKHPDAYRLGPKLEAWISSLPKEKSTRYRRILSYGGSNEVIEMLDDYKKQKNQRTRK